MWRKSKLFAVVCLCSCLLLNVSCLNRGNVRVDGKYLEMRHSSLLEIAECHGYTVVDVMNPWGAGLLDRYLLVPYDSVLPANLPSGTLLRTPLKSVILFSGVHANLLEELGVLSAVSGVCDSRYLYSCGVKQGLENGVIRDCGSSLNIDNETVVHLNPDAIFVLPYENGGYGKLERFSFPLVKCADYMETSPLACAEWMRFYARLLGCAEKGDSIYSSVCDKYEGVRDRVADVCRRPRLMCELKSSSAWYVPGGRSTMGQMYKDAGADYLFADYDVSGSVPLSVEVMLDKACDADIWLFKYNSAVDKRCADMMSEYDGYAHFKPFRNGDVYACNAHKNNVFEETAFHPERLLLDLAALFHPGLFPEYKTVYYEKLR